VFVFTLKIAGAEFSPNIRLFRQWTFAEDPAEVSVKMVLL
jgi:hypothetical protein